jgi:hypothetical protein
MTRRANMWVHKSPPGAGRGNSEMWDQAREMTPALALKIRRFP